MIALYFCTVFGIFRTKWFLVPLFGLPFLYHVFVEDLKALRDTANPVTFAKGMQEMGVLCIMLGLFFLALSMKRHVSETEEELPKIKAPKVLAPQQSVTADEAARDDTQTVAGADEQEIPASDNTVGSKTEDEQQTEE